MLRFCRRKRELKPQTTEEEPKIKKKPECPLCHGKHFNEEETMVLCIDCGLILQDNNEYVAGKKVFLPWGLKI